MNNITTYNEFINEEFNAGKTGRKLALATSLFGATLLPTSCVTDVFVYPTEVSNVKYIPDRFELPCVILVVANYCHYCKAMEPKFEEVKSEYPNIHFYILDISNKDSEEFDIADMFGVSSLPTTIFIDQSKKVSSMNCEVSKGKLRASIKKTIPMGIK